MKQAAMLIDGEWVSSNERIDSYNPATQATLQRWRPEIPEN